MGARDREIPSERAARTGAIISFDRLRRETDEISTKYNRGQKPVEKRGKQAERPRGGSLLRPEYRTSLSSSKRYTERTNERTSEWERSIAIPSNDSVRNADRAWVEDCVYMWAWGGENLHRDEGPIHEITPSTFDGKHTSPTLSIWSFGEKRKPEYWCLVTVSPYRWF